MLNIEISALQAGDLLKLIQQKIKRVNENGDGPYWREIQYIFNKAIQEKRDAEYDKQRERHAAAVKNLAETPLCPNCECGDMSAPHNH